MASAQEKITVATCDACGKRQIPDDGISGTATEVFWEKGYAFPLQRRAEWYSCLTAPGHIGKAIRKALSTDHPFEAEGVEGWPPAEIAGDDEKNNVPAGNADND